MAFNETVPPLLAALGRLGAGVRRRASWRKIGEIRTVPYRRAYESSPEMVQLSLEAMKRRFPDDEYYVLSPPSNYLSPEEKLTRELEAFMRDARSTEAAVQLKLDL